MTNITSTSVTEEKTAPVIPPCPLNELSLLGQGYRWLKNQLESTKTYFSSSWTSISTQIKKTIPKPQKLLSNSMIAGSCSLGVSTVMWYIVGNHMYLLCATFLGSIGLIGFFLTINNRPILSLSDEKELEHHRLSVARTLVKETGRTVRACVVPIVAAAAIVAIFAAAIYFNYLQVPLLPLPLPFQASTLLPPPPPIVASISSTIRNLGTESTFNEHDASEFNAFTQPATKPTTKPTTKSTTKPTTRPERKKKNSRSNPKPMPEEPKVTYGSYLP